VFNWLKKKNAVTTSPLLVDIHSHLLPGLDDGVKTLDESLEVILYLQSLGYRKLITTPHVMADAYKNSEATILEKLEEVKSFLNEKKIDIQLEAAAEYYLDEGLIQKLENKETLLTIGEKFLLFETNFLNEPFNLKDFIFLATTKGYKLILAHPERYLYLHENLSKAEDLLDRGVLFQINISSITGFYSKQARQVAYQFIDRGWVHWLGSDCHHLNHAQLVKEASSNKYFRKALTLPLLNNTLQ